MPNSIFFTGQSGPGEEYPLEPPAQGSILAVYGDTRVALVSPKIGVGSDLNYGNSRAFLDSLIKSRLHCIFRFEYFTRMQRGDAVRLKDGGKLVMVILHLDGDKAECIWRYGDRILSGKFRVELLERATSYDFSPTVRSHYVE